MGSVWRAALETLATPAGGMGDRYGMVPVTRSGNPSKQPPHQRHPHQLAVPCSLPSPLSYGIPLPFPLSWRAQFYHHAPIVPAKKGEGSPRRGAANSSLAAAQHSAPPPQHHHHHHPLPSARHASPHGHSTATHHATGHPRSAPASRPGSATGGGSGGAGAAGPPGSAGAALTSTSGPGVGTHRPASGRSRVLASTPPEGSARAQEAGKQAVAAAAAAAAAPGTQPGAGQRHRRSRSMSPGQAAAAAAAGGAGGGRAPHRKPLYPEDGPLKVRG